MESLEENSGKPAVDVEGLKQTFIRGQYNDLNDLHDGLMNLVNSGLKTITNEKGRTYQIEEIAKEVELLAQNTEINETNPMVNSLTRTWNIRAMVYKLLKQRRENQEAGSDSEH